MHGPGRSGNHFGNVAARLDELLDLFPGNEDFTDEFAARQLTAPQETPDGLGAHIEDLGGLVDVVQHRFNGGGFAGSVGRRFDVRDHIIGFVFVAGIGLRFRLSHF